MTYYQHWFKTEPKIKIYYFKVVYLFLYIRGLINNKKFVGLNNFIILFKDEKFIREFQNTVFLIVKEAFLLNASF